jgi:hypothetical protein
VRTRITGKLAVSLGCLFVALGIAETIRAVRSGDGGIWFWFGSLVGGGTLVIGGWRLRRRWPGWSAALVAIGSLAGTIATMWTLVVPLAALTLVVLVVLAAGEEHDSRAGVDRG